MVRSLAVRSGPQVRRSLVADALAHARFLAPSSPPTTGVTPLSVMTAICATFPSGAPAVCDCLNVAPRNVDSCMGYPPAATGMPGWGSALIALVVLGSVGSVGAAYYFHRRNRAEIDEAMDGYRSIIEATAGDGVVLPPRPPRVDNPVVARIKQLAATIMAPPVGGGTHQQLPTTSEM